jgi:hypothetical protein
MKKSSTIAQQLAALRQQLTQAKKHERRIAERQFIKLAKSLGIYGLPADQLQREFNTNTQSQDSLVDFQSYEIQGGGHEQA